MNASDTDAPPADFIALINHEGQYGLWPANKPVPEKWRPAGMAGSREACLAFVRRAWTDMRPRSVQQRHAASIPGAAQPPAGGDAA